MKGITTLTISPDEMRDAITFWLNNHIMKQPHKCISFVQFDNGTVEIKIEPIKPDVALPSLAQILADE